MSLSLRVCAYGFGRNVVVSTHQRNGKYTKMYGWKRIWCWSKWMRMNTQSKRQINTYFGTVCGWCGEEEKMSKLCPFNRTAWDGFVFFHSFHHKMWTNLTMATKIRTGKPMPARQHLKGFFVTANEKKNHTHRSPSVGPTPSNVVISGYGFRYTYAILFSARFLWTPSACVCVRECMRVWCACLRWQI